jgi:cell division protein ZapA
MKRPVEVEIMGQRLTVASDDGEEHVRLVAGYVDRQIRRLSQGRSPTATANLALLAALNIASEYWKLRAQQEEVEKTINRLSQRVLTRLGR